MILSRQKNRGHRLAQEVGEGWEGVPWERPFRNIKQARAEQALTTVKMLWADCLVKCCNPELYKLKGTWASLWEGSVENECPAGWLWDRVACPRGWRPHLWGGGCKARNPRSLEMLEVPSLWLDTRCWSPAVCREWG